MDKVTKSPARLLPRGLRRALRRRAEHALYPPLEKPVVDGELRARLEDLYAGEVADLRALTGQAFPSWSL